jgi:hypothetical protein
VIPHSLVELAEAVPPPRADARPPGGAMSRWLGHRYTAAEIWEAYAAIARPSPEDEKRLRPLADAVRAFDVEPLRGAVMTVGAGFPPEDALQILLARLLPGVAWTVPHSGGRARLDRRGVLHESILAPADDTTGAPMAIEIFGRGARPSARGGTVVTLESAVWANVLFPAVNVPFYD